MSISISTIRTDLNAPSLEKQKEDETPKSCKKSVAFFHELLIAPERSSQYDGLFTYIRRARILIKNLCSHNPFDRLFAHKTSWRCLQALRREYGPLVLTSALISIDCAVRNIKNVKLSSEKLSKLKRACPQAETKVYKQVFYQIQIDMREAIRAVKKHVTNTAYIPVLDPNEVPQTKILGLLRCLSIKPHSNGVLTEAEIYTILCRAKAATQDSYVLSQLSHIQINGGIELLCLAYSILTLWPDLVLPHCLTTPDVQPTCLITIREQYTILKNYSLASLYRV